MRVVNKTADIPVYDRKGTIVGWLSDLRLTLQEGWDSARFKKSLPARTAFPPCGVIWTGSFKERK